MTENQKKLDHIFSQIIDKNPEFTPDVREGIRLLQNGQRDWARIRLAHAVRINPANATAWYWLSRTVEGPQRQECLARMRRLDEMSVHRPITATVQPADIRRSQPIHGKRPKHHHPAHRRSLIVLAVTLITVILGAVLLGPSAVAQHNADQTRLQASGLIRAQEVSISSQYSGRIREIAVQEGEFVRAGQPLIRLDTTAIDAQIEVARAAVALAEAGLAQARAGARPGQIAIAEAQLAQAEAGRLAAAQAVTDTLMLLHNPQELRLKIALTEAQIKSLEHKLARALAYKDAAQIGKEGFEKAMQTLNELGGPGQKRFRVLVAEGSWEEIRNLIPPELRDQLPATLPDGTHSFGDLEIQVQGNQVRLYRWVTVDVNVPFEAHLAPNAWWQAWVGVNAAAAQKEGTEAVLAQLKAQLNNPQALRNQADQAAAALAQAEAQVKAAQAQVDGLRSGATAEQLAALEAQVAQARAALTTLETQRAQMTITAPADGLVVTMSVHEGEIAAQGAPLLTLADLSQVYLTVYLPVTQIGLVQTGSPATVRVDSFSDRSFAGTVIHIADSAQFTPRNVATREKRANLVFGVEIRLDNPDGALKPGMPADAVLGE